MINLSISAERYEDLHVQLKGLLYGLAQTAAAVAPTVQEQKQAEEDAKPKLTKKQIAEQVAQAKAAQEAAAKEPATETIAEVKEPATGEAKTEIPSIEDLRAALMSLSKAEGHGSEAVFKLLETFNAKNASTVREDQRALVIAAVKQKLEG